LVFSWLGGNEKGGGQPTESLVFCFKALKGHSFCIGQRALESPKVVGFKKSVLVNTPITLAPRSATPSPLAQTNIRRRLDLPTGSFLIASLPKTPDIAMTARNHLAVSGLLLSCRQYMGCDCV